jgi:ParB family chromosome partitioning protein
MEESMQATVPLSALLPPKDNPRRTLDQSLIAGLAQSIKTDGVLQNLLVRPEGLSS